MKYDDFVKMNMEPVIMCNGELYKNNSVYSNGNYAICKTTDEQWEGYRRLFVVGVIARGHIGKMNMFDPQYGVNSIVEGKELIAFMEMR